MSRSANRRAAAGAVLAAVAAAVLLGVGEVPAARAADTQGRFAVKGFGQVRCARFSDARTKRESIYLITGGWVEGYLTALNQTSDQTYDLTPFENTDLLMGLIDRHCRNNPDHRFADVVRSMAMRLVDERIAEYSELIVFEVNDVEGRIYSETVRRMQVRLAELGHYQGPADGQYSDATADAVRAFQAQMGTESTGVPDQLTLMRMFRLRERAPQ